MNSAACQRLQDNGPGQESDDAVLLMQFTFGQCGSSVERRNAGFTLAGINDERYPVLFIPAL
jgi:hypothetical protein